MNPSILVAADLHISDSLWKNQRAIKGDSPFGLTEITRVLRESECKHLILAGDIWDVQYPHSGMIRMFSRELRQWHDLGVEVYAIQGNHDKLSVPWFTAVTEYGAERPVIHLDRPMDINGWQVAGLDYADHDTIGKDLAAVGDWGPIDLLVMHQFAKQYMPMGANVDLDWAPPNVRRIVLGDIHEPWEGQTSDGRPAWYPGSLSARNIDEAAYDRSLLAFNTQADDASYVWRIPIEQRRIIKAIVAPEIVSDTLRRVEEFVTDRPTIDQHLAPVIYLRYAPKDNPEAPTLVEEIIRRAGRTDVHIVPDVVLAGDARTTERPDVGDLLSKVPTKHEALVAHIDPEEEPRAFALAQDLLDGTRGKALQDKLAFAQERFEAEWAAQ